LEPTLQIVIKPGGEPLRVWKGTTDRGVAVTVVIGHVVVLSSAPQDDIAEVLTELDVPRFLKGRVYR
jgi:hypothetical protein